MEQLKCMPGEVVKAEADYVFPAEKAAKIGHPKLVLTNQRLVWYETGITGKIKNPREYYLSDLYLENDEPQLFVKDSPLTDMVVTFYFIDGQVSFSATMGYKAGLKNLVSHVKNNALSDTKSIKAIVGGAEVLADTVGETINVFKKSLGIRTKRDEINVCRCSSCGASISGKHGDVIKCQYCGAPNRIP